jgi:hypothetical protein
VTVGIFDDVAEKSSIWLRFVGRRPAQRVRTRVSVLM